MGRHHISNVSFTFLQSLCIHAISVHLHRYDLISKTFKHPVCLLIRGVLHGNAPSRSQNLVQKHKQIFISRTYNNLICPAVYPSGGMEIFFYGLPKSRLPLRRTGEEHLLIILHQSIPGYFAPCIVGKMRQINSSGRKINLKSSIHGIRLPYKRFRSFRFHLYQFFHAQYIITFMRHRLDIPLRNQLIISHLGGGTAYFQIFRQNPGGGETLLLLEASFSYLSLYIFINLFIHGFRAAGL